MSLPAIPTETKYQILSQLDPLRWYNYPQYDFTTLVRLSERSYVDLAILASEHGNLYLLRNVYLNIEDTLDIPEGKIMDNIAISGHVPSMRFMVEDNEADPSQNHNSSLFFALVEEKEDMVKYLLSLPEVDPNDHIPEDATLAPIRLAARWGNVEIVRLILEHPRFNSNINTLLRALMDATLEQHQEVAKILAEAASNEELVE